MKQSVSRKAVYLTWESWRCREGEAVESSEGRRERLHRSISIHPIYIRQPEVLLQQQPQHRDRRLKTPFSSQSKTAKCCSSFGL